MCQMYSSDEFMMITAVAMMSAWNVQRIRYKMAFFRRNSFDLDPELDCFSPRKDNISRK